MSSTYCSLANVAKTKTFKPSRDWKGKEREGYVLLHFDAPGTRTPAAFVLMCRTIKNELVQFARAWRLYQRVKGLATVSEPRSAIGAGYSASSSSE